MIQNSSVISSQQLAKTLGLSEQECDHYLKHTQIKTPDAGKFWKIALIATPFWQRVSREIFGAYNEETGYLIQSLTGIRTVKAVE